MRQSLPHSLGNDDSGHFVVQKLGLARAHQRPDADKDGDRQMRCSPFRLGNQRHIEYWLRHHVLRAGRHLPFETVHLRIQVLRIRVKRAPNDKTGLGFQGFAGMGESFIQFFDDRDQLDGIHIVN